MVGMAREQTAEELVGYSPTEKQRKVAGPVKQVRKPGVPSDIEGRGPKLVTLEGETGKTMEQVIEEQAPELEPELDDRARERMDESLLSLVQEGGVESLKKALEEQGIDVLELDKHGLPIFKHDIRTDSIDYQRLVDYAGSEGFLVSDINAALVAREGRKKNKIDLREGLPSTSAKEKLKSGVRLDTEAISNKRDKEFVVDLLAKHPNLLHDLLTADQALDKTEVKLFPSGGKKPARVVISGESGGEPVSVSLSLDQWRLALKVGETPVLLPDIKAVEGTELVGKGAAEPSPAEAKTLADWMLALDALTVEGRPTKVQKVVLQRRVKKR